MTKILTFFTLCLPAAILCATATAQSDDNNKIKITIGTTSGCSDAANFIHQQLVPAYDVYKRFLDVEFIPWGRTRRDTNGSLICQFGASDCWANRLHRCVLDILKDDQDAQIRYMTCEFTRPFPAMQQYSYTCAAALGLNLIDVDYCVTTSGDELEDAAQEASAEPMQIINFVPFIVLNDIIDVNTHNEARRRLSSVLCFMLADVTSTGVTHCQI